MVFDAHWGLVRATSLTMCDDLLLLLGAELFEQPVGQHQVGATGVRQVIESVPVRMYGWQLLFLWRRFAVPRASGNG